MITTFSASGFRSLTDFSMEIRPGLNVLVGPNGAGKTNVIEALEFLAQLSRKTVGEAVGELGGVGRIVAKDIDDAYTSDVSLGVEGKRLISTDRYMERSAEDIKARRSLQRSRLARYKYNVSIRFEADKVFIAKESFSVWLRKLRRVRGEVIEKEVWNLDIPADFTVERSAGDERPKGKIRFTPEIRKFSESEYADRSMVEYLNGNGYRGDQSGERSVLVHGRDAGMNHIIYRLSSEFSLGALLNVVPDRVRAPIDIAARPQMESDGYGFAAALWALQKSSAADRYTKNDRPRIEQLVSYVQRANPQVQNIRAELDNWESKIAVACWLAVGDGTIKVPLSALSDGTLKWLALMTEIVTGAPLLAIEEPENFVHPAVQKALVEILRERFAGPPFSEAFTFLTTHSETLINALEPHEVAIVSMAQGKTIVTRPTNVSLLVSEIQKTGFGLGHYYLMGALDD